MAARNLSKSEVSYIKSNYLKISAKEMARVLGVSKSFILTYKKKNNLITPPEIIKQFRVAALRNHTTCTKSDDQYIKSNYLTIAIKQIARCLKCSETKVKTRMRQLNLVIPPEILLKRKQDSYIKTGNIPVNKGKKQTEFMSAEGIERTKRTRFRKGNIPATAYNEVGKVVIRKDHKDRHGREYYYKCISLGKWIPLHKYMWEQVNGKIQKGHCLWFKDGNSLNCDLDNLEVITLAENMHRNSGTVNLTDTVVASLISRKGHKVDADLKKEVLKHPNLIKLKKTQLLLQRAIKNGKRN